MLRDLLRSFFAKRLPGENAVELGIKQPDGSVVQASFQCEDTGKVCSAS